MNKIEIFSFDDFPLVKEGDDLVSLICKVIERNNFQVQAFDIFVISHKIVSKAEGRIVKLKDVKPSDFSIKLSKTLKKDPRYIELALREAKRVILLKGRHLITESLGIYPYSGIDISNVNGGESVVLLPLDPDASARRIREGLEGFFKKPLGVIISDTTTRFLRKFCCNIAIGISGVKAYKDYKGSKDLFGYSLKLKKVAIADEIASAAELLMGQGDEGRPLAIVRGLNLKDDESSSKELMRVDLPF
ncbi:Coenzyme F420:L-glutamate ligase [archaeon HR06]|nr:Coenzyme F420:L-glutamate ligase [archaeon HR06]